MTKFKKKGQSEIEATQFDPRDNWVECVKRWEIGKAPRDMSWGYIDRPGEGKIHVLAGDWIFKDEHGMWTAMHEYHFQNIYEPTNPKEESSIQ